MKNTDTPILDRRQAGVLKAMQGYLRRQRGFTGVSRQASEGPRRDDYAVARQGRARGDTPAIQAGDHAIRGNATGDVNERVKEDVKDWKRCIASMNRQSVM